MIQKYWAKDPLSALSTNVTPARNMLQSPNNTSVNVHFITWKTRTPLCTWKFYKNVLHADACALQWPPMISRKLQILSILRKNWLWAAVPRPKLKVFGVALLRAALFACALRAHVCRANAQTWLSIRYGAAKPGYIWSSHMKSSDNIENAKLGCARGVRKLPIKGKY